MSIPNELKESRVLVLGSAGLVGSCLIRELSLANCKNVIAVYHKKTPIFYNGISYKQADLTDKKKCYEIMKNVDYVFNVAAFVGGAKLMTENPVSLITNNIIMTCNILEAAYNSGVKKLLYLSSTTIYPESNEEMIEEQGFEGDPYYKYFQIGWVKRYGETLCNFYSTKIIPSIPYIVLRPSNIYGPNDRFHPENSHVLASLIRKVVEKQDPIKVWGNGKEIRDLIFVDDMVEAIFLAFEKINIYDPINIGYGKTYSVNQLLDMIMETENYHAKIIYDETKPTMIPIRKISIEKAKKLLNFEPKISMEEGIKRTISWYKENR